MSSRHTPAPSQMYSDTDYANLYLVFPPIPALGACYVIEVELRALQRATKWNANNLLESLTYFVVHFLLLIAVVTWMEQTRSVL